MGDYADAAGARGRLEVLRQFSNVLPCEWMLQYVLRNCLRFASPRRGRLRKCTPSEPIVNRKSSNSCTHRHARTCMNTRAHSGTHPGTIVHSRCMPCLFITGVQYFQRSQGDHFGVKGDHHGPMLGPCLVSVGLLWTQRWIPNRTGIFLWYLPPPPPRGPHERPGVGFV